MRFTICYGKRDLQSNSLVRVLLCTNYSTPGSRPRAALASGARSVVDTTLCQYGGNLFGRSFAKPSGPTKPAAHDAPRVIRTRIVSLFLMFRRIILGCTVRSTPLPPAPRRKDVEANRSCPSELPICTKGCRLQDLQKRLLFVGVMPPAAGDGLGELEKCSLCVYLSWWGTSTGNGNEDSS